MQPFVANRHGRLVFPSNFIPQLDFSVIDTEHQLIDVIDCTEDAHIVDASGVWRSGGRSWRHLSWWMTIREPEASLTEGSSDPVLITRIVNLRRADSC